VPGKGEAAARHVRIELPSITSGQNSPVQMMDAASTQRLRPRGSALTSMRERAAHIGAAFRVESRPLAGTSVTTVVPVASSGSLIAGPAAGIRAETERFARLLAFARNAVRGGARYAHNFRRLW
jgi:hypothetical protein